MRRVAAGLLATLAFGVWIRWRLAGVPIHSALEQVPFAFARHAHSHLGYYALLVPLAWYAWRARGHRGLKSTEALVYGIATVLATIGFLRSGYGALAIAGSTVVAVLWIVAAWRVARTVDARGPLALVFPGTLLSLAWIPVIAISLRRNPALSAAAVQTFLAALMFTVVAPSALSLRGIARHWPPLLVGLLGLGAAMALGVWPSVPARLLLAGYAVWWLAALRSQGAIAAFPARLALPWAAAGIGLLAMSSGLVPYGHDIGIAAVHYLALGPLLAMFLDARLGPRVAPWAWWLYQALVATFAGSIAARAFVPAAWPSQAAAVVGSAIFVWWALALWRSAAGAGDAAHREVHAA
ncbi:MAG TPA: hypothetical protein PK788_04375 [Gemmatimonadaceae bacterium]|nr:hypothetical protein [Gemmatimonadaceae bacterium]HRQ78659.1 hypothetical protein [Gemmatimonadaceae bacterium]